MDELRISRRPRRGRAAEPVTLRSGTQPGRRAEQDGGGGRERWSAAPGPLFRDAPARIWLSGGSSQKTNHTLARYLVNGASIS